MHVGMHRHRKRIRIGGEGGTRYMYICTCTCVYIHPAKCTCTRRVCVYVHHMYVYMLCVGRGWGVVYVTGLGSFLPFFTLSMRYLLVCYTHVFSFGKLVGGSTCPLPPPVPTSMRCMYHDRQRVTRLLEPNWTPSCGERVSSFGHQLCDHVGVAVLLEGSRLPVTGLSGIGEAAVLIFNPK